MTYYVVYSPRGFANELNIAEFATRAEASDFRSEVDNDVNSYSIEASSPTHRNLIRSHKREVELYGRW